MFTDALRTVADKWRILKKFLSGVPFVARAGVWEQKTPPLVLRYPHDGGNIAMNWYLSHRADPHALPLADRHYSRQKPGTGQFVPPGRCLVLLTRAADALWVTSWPQAEFVKHRWAGAWVCSLFRNEGPILSSILIREAVAVTRWHWLEVPDLGMVTFVDARKTRHKRDPGRCFQKAGFRPVGQTQGGLVALQLLYEDLPKPQEPASLQLSFLL